MTGRNTIFEKDPTQSRVVAVGRGFHPSLQLTWNTNARVLRAQSEVHANFVLRSQLVWTKKDETRFRAPNKQRLEIMVVVVSDVRVNVGIARKLGLPHQRRTCCCRASLHQLIMMLDLSRPVRSVLLWFQPGHLFQRQGYPFTEVGGGSSTVFPRLVVRKLRASGNAARFAKRPMSPDLSSFSNRLRCWRSLRR